MNRPIGNYRRDIASCSMIFAGWCRTNIADSIRCSRQVLCLLLLVGLITPSFAQSPAGASASIGPGADALQSLDYLKHSKFRQVFVPERDKEMLIPPDYVPISPQRLKAALSDLHEEPFDSEAQPRLNQVVLMARYDEGALQSIGRSYFDLQYADDAPGRILLTPLSLAVLPAVSTIGPSDNRLSTSFDGHAQATISGDARLEFAWSLRGTRVDPNRTRFQLALPPTGHNELYLVIPRDCDLQTKSGAIKEIDVSAAPVDSLQLGEDEKLTVLQLAGTESIQFSVVKNSALPLRNQVILRDAIGKYQIREDSVAWDISFDFTWPRDNGPVALRLPDGSVPTLVTVDSSGCEYQQISQGGENVLLLSPSALGNAEGSIDHTLSISGILGPLESGWGTLPTVAWHQCETISSGTGALLQLDLSFPLELTDVDTANQWSVANTSRSDLEKTYQFTGRNWDAPLRIFVQHGESHATADNALRLNIGSDLLQATWDSVVQYDVVELPANSDATDRPRTPTIGPIAIEVEDGWEILSAVIVSSGREIDRVGSKVDQLLIWPEPDEVDGKALHVRVKGRRPLPSQDRVSIPPTYFVRWQSVPATEYVMLTASSRILFRSNQGLQQNRVSEKQLPPEIVKLFGPKNDAQCYLAIDGTRTPSIDFDRPASRFDVRVEVATTVREGRIAEEFTVGIENVSGKLDAVDVRFPKSRDEPIRWTMADAGDPNDEGTRRNAILASRVTTQDGAEIWTLRSPQRIDDGTVIIGVREVNASELLVDLPSVPLAFNQRGIVRTDRSVEVVSLSPNVVRIPEPKRVLTESPQPVLRYDPTVDGQVLIQARRLEESLPVVEHHATTVVANASGSERVFVEIDLAAPGSIAIQHEPALKLERAIGEDGEIPADRIRRSQGRLTFNLSTQRSLLLVFGAQRKTQVWGRRWNAPRIDCLNPVLQSSLDLYLGPETVQPSWDGWFDDPSSDKPTPPQYVSNLVTIPLTSVRSLSDPGQAIVLVRSEAMAGLKFGIAILLFALGWWTGQRQVFVYVGVTMLLILGWATSRNWNLDFILLPLIPYAIGALAALVFVKSTPNAATGSTRASLSSRSVVLRSALIVGWLAASIGNSFADIDPKTHTLLIPIEEDGSISDMIYIPSDLNESLRQRGAKASQSVPAQISSARYIVDIRSNAFVAERDAARVQATIGIENDDLLDSVAMVIPRAEFRQAIRRIDLLVGGDVIPIRRPVEKQEDRLLLDLDGQPNATVRFSLAVPTQIDEATGQRRLALDIPPILNSQLAVMYDEEVRDVEAVSSLGGVTTNAETDSLSADLGPVDRLQVAWHKQNSDDSVPLVNTRRAWYLHLTDDQVSREVQLEFQQPESGKVDRVELNFDTTVTPIITSGAWRLESKRLLDGDRSSITFAAASDVLSPLRLLWVAARDDAPLQTIRLVDIRSLAAADSTPDVLIGICAPGNWTIEDPFESLATISDSEEFLTHWNARTGSLSKVYRSEYKGPIPFRLQKSDMPQAVADDLHQINLEVDRMEINYKLTIDDYQTAGESIRLEVPKDLKIDSVILQGESTAYKRLAFDDHDELLIAWRVDPDPTVELYLKASVPVQMDQATAIPRIFPGQFALTGSEYQWSRASGVAQQWIEQEAFENLPFEVTGVEQLHAQMFPITRWSLDVRWLSERVLPGSFKLTRMTPLMESESVTVVSWKDRAWSAKASFDIEVSKGSVDFFSFEVPTSWFNEVSVDDDLPWIAMPSVNRDSKIVLVLPTRPTADRYQITIRGGPRSTASERVTVPAIRMLETGKHRQYFAVPRRLINEAIAWKVTSANEVTLRESLARFAGVPDDHVTYEANPNFSASLNPVLDLTIESLVTLATFEFFETAESSHLRCTWDFIAAGRDQLSLQLPPAYNVISSRINGIETDVRQVADEQVDVQLLYSQLPQHVELLLEIPITDSLAQATVRLPQVVGVPVSASWFLIHDNRKRFAFEGPTNVSVTSTNWETSTPERLSLAKAASVLTCLDTATESLQERTSYELVHWLTPWVARFDNAVEEFSQVQPDADAQVAAFQMRMDQLIEQTGVETLVRQATGVPRRSESIAMKDGVRVLSVSGQYQSIDIVHPNAVQVSRLADIAKAFAIFFGLFAVTAIVMRLLHLNRLWFKNAVWLGILIFAGFLMCPPPLAWAFVAALTGLVLLSLIQRYQHARALAT
ncbi:MAG: hypothetical protein R3C05_23095 [Pirellulaceae bacterium]